ncbi:monocarboxylate transporter 7-like [Diadema setosum]|uniref:monocarboxylate transporter 7-like n=1 Tax=Diadema setosum TaxID=31175 RepID=UPI003B3AD906
MARKKTCSHGYGHDGGWPCIVLAAAFVHRFLTYGIVKSMGILVPSLADQLSASYTTIGFLFSLEHTLCTMLCPFANLLLRKNVSPRVLTISCGLVTGLSFILLAFVQQLWLIGMLLIIAGSCTAPFFQVASIAMKQHFGVRYGSVNAITQLGSVAGGVALPYITSILFQSYGLAGTFLCMGAILLNRCPVGAALKYTPESSRGGNPGVVTEDSGVDLRVQRSRGRPCSDDGDDAHLEAESRLCEVCEERTPWMSEEGEDGCIRYNGTSSKCKPAEESVTCHPNTESNQSRDLCRKFLHLFPTVFDFTSIAKEWRVTAFFLPGTFLMDFCLFGFALFSTSYGRSVGIAETQVVYLPIVGAAGGVLSRILLVFLLYIRPFWSSHLFLINALISAAAFLVFTLNSSFVNLMFCSALAGFGLFGANSSFNGVISVSVTKKNFPAIVAASFFLTGAGAVVSGSLTGYLYDVTQSFKTVFRVYSGLCFAVVLHVLISYKFRRVDGEEMCFTESGSCSG